MGALLSIAAVLSMIGLFVGNSLGGSRIPFALAEDGMFPRWLVKVHDKYGTPWVSILFVGVLFTLFATNAFAFLVVADVFLQCLVILAEFAALWKLRFSHPDVPRDKVPGGYLGLVLVTLGPTAIILVAIVSQYRRRGLGLARLGAGLHGPGRVVVLPVPALPKAGRARRRPLRRSRGITLEEAQNEGFARRCGRRRRDDRHHGSAPALDRTDRSVRL